MKEKYDFKRDGRSPIPEKISTSRVMSANKARNSKPELVLRKHLWQSNLKGYRLHYKGLPGRPDLVYLNRKVAVFINGCFWHRCPLCNPNTPKTNKEFWKVKFENNIKRDAKKKSELEALGWTVITIWECQIKRDVLNQVSNIQTALKNRANSK